MHLLYWILLRQPWRHPWRLQLYSSVHWVPRHYAHLSSYGWFPAILFLALRRPHNVYFWFRQLFDIHHANSHSFDSFLSCDRPKNNLTVLPKLLESTKTPLLFQNEQSIHSQKSYNSKSVLQVNPDHIFNYLCICLRHDDPGEQWDHTQSKRRRLLQEPLLNSWHALLHDSYHDHSRLRRYLTYYFLRPNAICFNWNCRLLGPANVDLWVFEG